MSLQKEPGYLLPFAFHSCGPLFRYGRRRQRRLAFATLTATLESVSQMHRNDLDSVTPYNDEVNILDGIATSALARQSLKRRLEI